MEPLRLNKVDSDMQKADIFTKGLGIVKFQGLRHLLVGWWTVRILALEGESRYDALLRQQKVCKRGRMLVEFMRKITQHRFRVSLQIIPRRCCGGVQPDLGY